MGAAVDVDDGGGALPAGRAEGPDRLAVTVGPRVVRVAPDVAGAVREVGVNGWLSALGRGSALSAREAADGAGRGGGD